MSFTPETVMFLFLQSSLSICDKRLEINDVEEALSSRARASIDEPFGVVINIRHVISRVVSELISAKAFAETVVDIGEGSE